MTKNPDDPDIHILMDQENRSLLFDKLEQIGVHHVEVSYCGSNDEGEIDTISLFGMGMEISQPTTEFFLKTRLEQNERAYGEQRKGSNSGYVKHETSLDAALSNVCYHALHVVHPGWELNDGSYGTFEFKVPNRQINLTHNAGELIYHQTKHELNKDNSIWTEDESEITIIEL